MVDFCFGIIKKDKGTQARFGRMMTPHGEVTTPVFIPVGTQGTVKSLTPEDLVEIGIEMLLGNTYHLYLRPGVEVIKKLGGLHRFIHWDRPLLTDSGGFQVYSLSALRKISKEGVLFRSHLDGSDHFLTPEKSIEIQQVLGADVMMALDECLPYPVSYGYAEYSTELTSQWARRCLEARTHPWQALFAVVQGGMYPDLRERSAKDLTSMEFDGYALGGLSVGETKETMFAVVEATVPLLPEEKPRYLMGVGKPEDLVRAVALGVDLFDCVIPTRNARNGMLFTSFGKLMLKRQEFAADERPVDETCTCYTCRSYSRAYLRHLFLAGEILSPRLNTIHNLYYYCELIAKMRGAIVEGRFAAFARQYIDHRQAVEEAGKEKEVGDLD